MSASSPNYVYIDIQARGVDATLRAIDRVNQALNQLSAARAAMGARVSAPAGGAAAAAAGGAGGAGGGLLGAFVSGMFGQGPRFNFPAGIMSLIQGISGGGGLIASLRGAAQAAGGMGAAMGVAGSLAGGAISGLITLTAELGKKMANIAIMPLKMIAILEAFRIGQFIVDMPKRMMAAAVDIINVTGTYQQFRLALEAVMGSAQAAEEHFRQLQEVAKLPGIDTEQALRWSLALQAVGYSSAFAARSAVAWSNALALAGRSASDLPYISLALTQMGQATFNYGQEIRQFREHVPQFTRALMELYGTARSQDLVKMGITGKQIITDVTNWMMNLPKAPYTLSTAIENLTDSMNRFKAAIGDLQITPIISFMKQLAEILDTVRQRTDFVRESIATIGQAATGFLREALAGTEAVPVQGGQAGLIGGQPQKVFKIPPELGSMMDWMAIAMATIETLIKKLPELLSNLGKRLNEVLPDIITAINFFTQILIPTGKIAVNTFAWIAAVMTEGITSVVWAILTAVKGLTDVLKWIPGKWNPFNQIDEKKLDDAILTLGNVIALQSGIIGFRKMPFKELGSPFGRIEAPGPQFRNSLPLWAQQTLDLNTATVEKWRQILSLKPKPLATEFGPETGWEAKQLDPIARATGETARNTRQIADAMDWAIKGYGVTGTEALMPRSADIYRWLGKSGGGAVQVSVNNTGSFEGMLADLVTQTIAQLRLQGAI